MAAIPSDGGPLAFVDDLDAPQLSDEDRHHLERVRRLRSGDPLIVGDGAGAWRRARFAASAPEPDGEIEREEAAAPALSVGFALVKGSKPELVVQKLVELGIDVIRPFLAARSVVQWDDRKAGAAHARWEKVAIEAAMQSRRAWLATVEPLTGFDAVAAIDGACRADRSADGSGPTLEHPLVLVGPEGGWDDRERAAEIPVVALGQNVLRAETAAITAGALLAALRAGVVTPT